MLNAHALNPDFIAALKKSWDQHAIWPGCKNDYVHGVSPDCYGQCLAATLHAWIAHGGPEKGYHLIPGIAYGPDLRKAGMLHFQLVKIGADGTQVPIDVTWHQFQKDVVFKPASPQKDPAAFGRIMRESLMEDDSLAARVGILSDNLRRNGFEQKILPHDIVAFAQDYFREQAKMTEEHVLPYVKIDVADINIKQAGYIMSGDFNVAAFDTLIDKARAKFRGLVASNPTLFGGQDNPRIEATIGEHAPRGTIGVPQGIYIDTTQGLMAGVDLTLLNKEAPLSEVVAVAKHAKDQSAATVCVYPEHVSTVQATTGGYPSPIAVVGFPSVSDPVSAVEMSLEQTRAAIRDGAREIDMVLAMNYKDGNPDYQAHYNYIRQVVSEAAKSRVPVKVILETAYLADEQKVEASMIAKMAGAAFVKTSTGFAQDDLMRSEIPKTQKGATPHDVALMRRTVGDTTLNDGAQSILMGVKASGNVRNREQAVAVYRAGASRIGASGGIDVRTVAEKQIDRREASQAAAGGRAGSY
ncbi:MAG: deoxyribose-phosphate aldolase [Rickettsiales bacterium]